MTTKRDNAYAWVTWLSRIMSGDDSCQWARWFKIHYQDYEKAPSDFDTVGWLVRHTRLVNEQADIYQADDWTVTLENQNAFKLDWYLSDEKTKVVLSGKPDIVARRGKDVLIIDAKTGKPKISDRFQVLLYMMFQEFEHWAGFLKPAEKAAIASLPEISGLLVYKDYSAQSIPNSMLDEDFRNSLSYWLNIVAANDMPRRVPSKPECRFCDITAADCPDRIEVE